MVNIGVYREVKGWKKPLHFSRTLFAKAYLKLLPKIEIIGITGSVGKTLTQNVIYSVLSQKYKTVVGDENLDPTFRIPQTILKAKPWDQKLILEYGIEHPGDMDHYLNLVKPNIAVVTAISPTHTKYLKNVEGVFREKSKLVTALAKSGYAVLNAQDQYCHKMASMTSSKIWWYGPSVKNGLKITNFRQNLNGSRFNMDYLGQKSTVKWKIIGRHQLMSAYAAATVGLICKMSLQQISRGLSKVKSPIHRLTPIVVGKTSIIDDTYNSSPNAVLEAIDTLIDLGKNKQKIAILGEMKDLGRFSNNKHKMVGEKIASSNVDYLMTVGLVAGQIADAAKNVNFGGKILKVASTHQALEKLETIATGKSLILVKGSRHAHLERVVQGLMHQSTKIDCYHCGKLR